MAAANMTIAYPWATVQRHLKGKHNQKDHGQRGAVAVTADMLAQYRSWGIKDPSNLYRPLTSQRDIKAWAEEAERRWAGRHSGTMAEFLDKAFNYHDPETGLSTRIKEMVMDDGEVGEIYLRGSVLDKDGTEIGRFSRAINDTYLDPYAPEGTARQDIGVAYNITFQIDKKGLQGQGFGTRMYKHLEETYQGTGGFDLIRLDANQDVGGYAWAKMGYDFFQDESRAVMRDNLAREFDTVYGRGQWEKRVASGEITEPHHSWDFAAFTGPNGERMGKKIMLGSGWTGYKMIDEDHPTWQTGRAYYESKGL